MQLKPIGVVLLGALGAACARQSGIVERVAPAPGGRAALVQLRHINGGATIPDTESLCLLRDLPQAAEGESFVCPPEKRVLEMSASPGLTVIWRGPAELELGIRQDARVAGFVSESQGIHLSLARYD